jgi:chemotaxis methyl-accepting protein methylase
MFKTIRSEKTVQIPVVTGSKPYKWGNLNSIRHEGSRHFRNKKREYLKDKINELAARSKNKNIRDLYRGINEFKKGYQPRTT